MLFDVESSADFDILEFWIVLVAVFLARLTSGIEIMVVELVVILVWVCAECQEILAPGGNVTAMGRDPVALGEDFCWYYDTKEQ